MYMTVKETAKMCGVTIQTLRNWDKNGYLKAERTLGGHRRYLIENVSNLLNGKKKIDNVIYSWEGQHEEHIEELLKQEGEKDPRAKACGGFSKAEIGMLLKNQDTVFDVETQELNKDLEFFYELAASMSAPYLFAVRVMTRSTGLITYRRLRNMAIVCESEDVVAMTHAFKYQYYDCNKELLKSIVEKIDADCVQNVIMNAKFLETCTYQEINNKILSVITKINEATGTKEPIIVMIPPELSNHNDETRKLTNTLKVSLSKNDKYTLFVSRLLSEDQILIGTKSEDKFGGYFFCPYMLMCQHKQDRMMMRFGRKLLREGNNCYGVITVTK